MPPPTRPTVPPQAPPEGDPSAVLGRLDLSSGERQPTPIELVGGRIRSVDVDRDFGGLDRGQQSIAFLGSRKRLSIISPPGDTRFLTITNPTEASEHTRDFLEAQNLTRPFDLRLPVRSPHDTLQVSQHLTSSAHNGPHLLHRALQSDMPIGINMATNKEGIAVRLGGAVFVIHPTLHDTGPNNVDSPSLTKTTPGGVDTTTTVTAGEMDTPPSYFAPTYSSREAIESARKESLQTPRRDGRCTYMTIDPNLFLRSPDESINAKRVFQTISGLATSQDFYITSDNRGNIVIIALTQRAGGSLARWANATFACTNNRANIFLGNDNLTQTETGLIIANYLRTEELDN